MGKGAQGAGDVVKTSDSLTLRAKGHKDVVINTIHFSCQSDKVRMQKGFKYFGMVYYSLGTLTPKTGVSMKPGYVYIRESTQLQTRPGDDGIGHGALCRLLTGWQPSEIANAGGSVGGFSI